MSKVILLLALFGLALGALDITYNTGNNISSNVINNNEWQYRQVSFNAANVLGWYTANYASLGLNINTTQGSADFIGGAAYVFPFSWPFSFIARVAAEADWKTNGTVLGWATTSDFKIGTGFVGSTYLWITETAPNGTVVATQNLRYEPLVPSDKFGYQYQFTDNTKGSSTLKSVVFTGKNGDTTVAISYIVSSVAGVLNAADAVVGPKALESVIEINNWAYQSQENSLNLFVGVGSGQADIKGNGRVIATLLPGTQVYFSAGPKAKINGNSESVKITYTGNVTADIPSNDYFRLQLQAAYAGDASFNVVKVTFPAGASSIQYDPAVGAGQPMDDPQGSSASSVALGFISVLALIVLLF